MGHSTALSRWNALIGQDQDAPPLSPLAAFADVLPAIVLKIGVILLMIARTGSPRDQKWGNPISNLDPVALAAISAGVTAYAPKLPLIAQDKPRPSRTGLIKTGKPSGGPDRIGHAYQSRS